MLMLSNSVSTATGLVRVSAGTLAFHPSASWTTASSVTVTNGDEWVVQSGGDHTSANCPFIKSGTLRVSGTGLLLLFR